MSPTEIDNLLTGSSPTMNVRTQEVVNLMIESFCKGFMFCCMLIMLYILMGWAREIFLIRRRRKVTPHFHP